MVWLSLTEHLEFQSGLLKLILFPLFSAAPTSTREIKSYRLIDFSGLDSPEMLRKADSPPPVFPPLMENELDFNELGCSTFTHCFSFLFTPPLVCH